MHPVYLMKGLFHMENLEKNGLIYSGTLIVITFSVIFIDKVCRSIVLPCDVLTYAYIIQYLLNV